MDVMLWIVAAGGLVLGFVALSRITTLAQRVDTLERQLQETRLQLTGLSLGMRGVREAQPEPAETETPPVPSTEQVPNPNTTVARPVLTEGAAQAVGVAMDEALGGALGVAALVAPPIHPRPSVEPRKPLFQPLVERVRNTEEWEALIGGRWLNRIGAAALILGMGLFFKFAVDNGWISESARIGIGLAVGLALLTGAWHTNRRDLPIFAQGLVGAGLAVLYLSIYAAADFYHLIPQPVALAGMALVTALAFVQALYHDSLAVALLAWAGGFLTIPLLGISKDQQLGVILYVALLDAGILSIVFRRDRWLVLEPLAMAATYATYFGWYLTSYDSGIVALAAIAVTLFWLPFYGLDVARIVFRRRTHRDLRHVLGGTNALLYFGALFLLLHDHPLVLGPLALALGVMYLQVVLVVRRAHTGDDTIVVRYVLTSIVLAVLATPFLTTSFSAAILWSLEALALVYLGVRWARWYVWWPGAVVYAIASLWLVGAYALRPYASARFVPVLNERALAFLLLAATLAAGAHLLGRLKHRGVASFVASLEYAWCAAPFLWLTIETHDVFSANPSLSPPQLQALTIAVIWMAYAVPLVYLGLCRGLFPVLTSGLAAAALAFGLGAGAGVYYGPVNGYMPVLNARALILALLIGGLAVLMWLLRRERDRHPVLGSLITGYRLAIVLLGFELVTAEIHDYFLSASGSVSESAGPSGTFIELMILAAVWMLYSFPLVRYGLSNRALGILIAGLGSLGLATGAVAVAGFVYRPDSWLSLALSLRPVILLFLTGGLCVHMRLIRNGQKSYAWLDTVLVALQAGSVLLGFELISAQTRDVFSQQIAGSATATAAGHLRNLEQLTLSLLWLVYAIALLGVGFWRRLRWLRLAAMGLLGVALLKIVIYDLSFLSPAYRSLSFVGLGVILLAASYLYQRYRGLLLEAA